MASAATLLAVVGCERGHDAKAPASPPAPPPPSVVVAEVLRRPGAARARLRGPHRGGPHRRDPRTGPGRPGSRPVPGRLRGERGAGALRHPAGRVPSGGPLRLAPSSPKPRPISPAPAMRPSWLARTRNLRQAVADLDKSRKDVARYRPLVDARALPVQDLDTALSQEEVGAAGSRRRGRPWTTRGCAQRTQIELAEASVEAAQAAVTPGGAQPRLHHHPVADHRHHRQDPGRSGQPGRQGRAHAPDDGVGGRPHLRGLLHHRRRPHLLQRADPRPAPSGGRPSRPAPTSSSSCPTGPSSRRRAAGLRRPRRGCEDRHHRRPRGVPQSSEGGAAGAVRAGARGGRGGAECRPGAPAGHPGAPGEQGGARGRSRRQGGRLAP